MYSVHGAQCVVCVRDGVKEEVDYRDASAATNTFSAHEVSCIIIIRLSGLDESWRGKSYQRLFEALRTQHQLDRSRRGRPQGKLANVLLSYNLNPLDS